MKYQVLFSLKNNNEKYLRLSSAAVMIGALRVNNKPQLGVTYNSAQNDTINVLQCICHYRLSNDITIFIREAKSILTVVCLASFTLV